MKKKKLHGHWIDLWREIKGEKWDIIIDLRNTLLSRVIKCDQKYIYSSMIGADLHKVEQYSNVLETPVLAHPVIWSTAEQEKKAAALIPDGGPVLAMGPTANWIGKMWPVERFISVQETLTGPNGILPGARVAVFAAPGEELIANKLLMSIDEDRRIDVIAKVDPGTAATAIKRCDLYVGNDSGLMHCAAAARVPTVGLFGPSYPGLYGPWGEHTTFVSTPETYDELIAFEGYHPDTLEFSLMDSLKTGTVLEEIKKFWDKHRKAA